MTAPRVSSFAGWRWWSYEKALRVDTEGSTVCHTRALILGAPFFPPGHAFMARNKSADA